MSTNRLKPIPGIDKEILRDAVQTFGPPAGRRTLFRLMKICGYQIPSVVADENTNEIQINSTVYNEGRRNLYLTVRGWLPAEVLRDVEHRQTLVSNTEEELFS